MTTPEKENKKGKIIIAIIISIVILCWGILIGYCAKGSDDKPILDCYHAQVNNVPVIWQDGSIPCVVPVYINHDLKFVSLDDYYSMINIDTQENPLENSAE